MKTILDFFAQHPVILASIGTVFGSIWGWFTNKGATRIISALPAPTATSTDRYIFWFKYLNNMCGNEERANSTALEHSPNFAPSVKQFIAALPAEHKSPTLDAAVDQHLAEVTGTSPIAHAELTETKESK